MAEPDQSGALEKFDSTQFLDLPLESRQAVYYALFGSKRTVTINHKFEEGFIARVPLQRVSAKSIHDPPKHMHGMLGTSHGVRAEVLDVIDIQTVFEFGSTEGWRPKREGVNYERPNLKKLSEEDLEQIHHLIYSVNSMDLADGIPGPDHNDKHWQSLWRGLKTLIICISYPRADQNLTGLFKPPGWSSKWPKSLAQFLDSISTNVPKNTRIFVKCDEEEETKKLLNGHLKPGHRLLSKKEDLFRFS
jgi:hypothetical protein